MALPPTVTIRDLNGVFVLNKTLSQSPDALLALQGLSWLTRKAIWLATITLTIRSYTDSTSANPPPDAQPVTTQNIDTATPTVTHIDITSTVSGLRTTTQENRTLDWTTRSHHDSIFGHVEGRSRFITTNPSSESTFSLARDADPQSNLSESSSSTTTRNSNRDCEPTRTLDTQFLTGQILSDGSTASSFHEPESVQSYSRSVDRGSGSGWTAEQTWNSEVINGKRYYTRRVVCWSTDGQKVERIRLVYDYLRGLEGNKDGEGDGDVDDGLAYGDDS